MKSTPSTHFKIGLLALVAILGLILAALGLGIRAFRTPSARYHTYFDESVQGLEIGAPVKFRGVRIGSVSKIAIAPDQRWIDVELALDEVHVRRLGLEHVHPSVRAQLSTQGITGVKYIDMEYVDPAVFPPPKLSFQPARRYIPSRPSLLRGLQTRLESTTEQLPDLVEDSKRTLRKINQLLDEIQDRKLIARASDLLAESRRVASEVRQVVRDAGQARLPERTAAALDKITAERGVIDSAQRAFDWMSDLGRDTSGATTELQQTIRDIGDAARAFRDLVDAIEAEPDMLVKGRARKNKP
ncbi:MAG: MlaD family protein [Kofleriaceae bacterium]